MLHPLRLARLSRDHGDGVWRGGCVLGGKDVVEQHEPAGVLPQERDGVAVDIAHDEPRKLSAHRRSPFGREARVFVGRKAVHRRDGARYVQFAGQARVAVVYAVDEGRVLFRADAKRYHGPGLPRLVRKSLGEARSMCRIARSGAVGIQTVGARKRAELVVERVVLVEDDEHVFHAAPQCLDEFFARQRHVRSCERCYLRSRIGLRSYQRWRLRGGRSGGSKNRQRGCPAQPFPPKPHRLAPVV